MTISKRMKKIISYILAAASVFLAAACVEEAGKWEPSLQLSTTAVQLSAEGSMQKIVYQVQNVADPEEIYVSYDADWLTVSTLKAKLIEVSATKNESGAERKATLTVTYPGLEDVLVEVSQAAWNAPIVLTVNGTESTSVSFSVITSSDDLTWVGQVVGKEWFDSMNSDEQIFQEDLSYYSLEAQNQNISVPEYLKTILNKGSYENLQYKGLDPDSDYVVYVYGITPEGERTTEVYSAAARTQPPYEGPISLTVDVTETDNIMDITVTPSHDGVNYYWNLMDRPTYEEYAAVHGDDPMAVFQAYIEWDIQDLIEYQDITTRAEYYEWYSDINQVNSQFECLALTEYIVFACKWDEDCHLTGEPAYVWHTTSDVAPSDNVITVTVGDDVDQSSFFVDVQTTNNDPYVMIAEPSKFMEGMNEEEIYAHLMEDYGTWGILSFVYEGSLSGRMTGLEPDTEYTMVVFGYKAGKQTTAMQKFTVRTSPAGPAEDCRFDFQLQEAGSNSLTIAVTPTDAAHYYYWYVYPVGTTADQVKTDVTDLINKSYYGDMYEFSYYELSQGKSVGTISFLAPETEYVVAAVVMDEESGAFLADVIFSDPFKTGEENYADITITAGYDKFYNGDDLYELNADAGAQYRGYAMVPVTIQIDGEYKSYYYTMIDYVTGLEDPEVYPDAALYETLVYYGVYYAETVNFRAPWNKTVLLAAMAIDNEGRYSRVFRQKCQFKKYNAADINELFTKSAGFEEGVDIPLAPQQQEIKVEKQKEAGDSRFNLDNLEKIKRENRIRRF
jgi:hypothetical protein